MKKIRNQKLTLFKSAPVTDTYGAIKFSEKLTFRNNSFLKKIAYVLNGWPLSNCFTRREILEVYATLIMKYYQISTFNSIQT